MKQLLKLFCLVSVSVLLLTLSSCSKDVTATMDWLKNTVWTADVSGVEGYESGTITLQFTDGGYKFHSELKEIDGPSSTVSAQQFAEFDYHYPSITIPFPRDEQEYIYWQGTFSEDRKVLRFAHFELPFKSTPLRNLVFRKQ